MTAPLFKPATRRAVKLKLAVQGPSGSGKTMGALALATGLAQGGKIAVIDTENGSASLYADRYTFDVLELRPPYTSKRYLEAIKAAAEAGFAVVVVDSLSHQWAGAGGILERKDEADTRPGSNSYTNWGAFTKEHEAFKAGILHAPIHIVATMRAKQDYILETNKNGKQVPRKVGLAPIQREGTEYEFAVVFDVQMDHKAVTSKDRTALFEGLTVDLTDKEVVASLLGWLNTAAPAAAAEPDPLPVEPEPAPAPAPTPRAVQGRAARPSNVDGDGVIHEGATVGKILMPFGKHKGEKLDDVPADYLEWALENMSKLDDGLRAAIVANLRDRKAAAASKANAVASQSLDEPPMMLDEEDDDLPF